MGFLQAREKAMQKQRQEAVGAPAAAMKPCLVYFGCRDSSEQLYSEQMHKWRDEGVITGLHVAQSRGKGPKVRGRSRGISRGSRLCYVKQSYVGCRLCSPTCTPGRNFLVRMHQLYFAHVEVLYCAPREYETNQTS